MANKYFTSIVVQSSSLDRPVALIASSLKRDPSERLRTLLASLEAQEAEDTAPVQERPSQDPKLYLSCRQMETLKSLILMSTPEDIKPVVSYILDGIQKEIALNKPKV